MIAFGVKYRPSEWEEVIGQRTIIEILKNQVQTESLKNSLFAGASGCGKTTIARLIAKYYNAELIEIDAASNNGVDNIRLIGDKAYERSLSNKYKIILLDEAHMLTTQAWNAFLKTLEESPKYTIFILCTTDPQKIPETILNRVQRFNFSKIATPLIVDKLKEVCNKEGLNYEEKALYYIGRLSKGSVREALSLLGQISDLGKGIRLEDSIKLLGDLTYDTFIKLTNYLLDGDEKKVLNLIDTYYDSGNNLKLFVNQYLDFCLKVDKYILLEEEYYLNPYKKEIESITNFENPSSYYNYLINKLVDLKNRIKQDLDIKPTIEAILLQIARCE